MREKLVEFDTGSHEEKVKIVETMREQLGAWLDMPNGGVTQEICHRVVVRGDGRIHCNRTSFPSENTIVPFTPGCIPLAVLELYSQNGGRWEKPR